VSKARWPCSPRYNGSVAAQRELADIKASLGGKSRRFDLRGLFTGRLRRMLIFGFGIAFFQQATGINAVFYYLPTIFAQAGGGLSTAFGQSVFGGPGQSRHDIPRDLAHRRLGRKPSCASA